jgi:hypothetical protein
MPYKGDEFHHFGWNACSSALSPLTGHAFVERRYLIIPGIRSSRIYVVDTKPHPTEAKIHKIIEPEEVLKKTGYSRPHTVHCGPEGIYVSTLGGGGKDGTEGPPGVFIMDCETFDILGRWEIDRGPQKLQYDFWWNLPRDYMLTSEWGLPPQYENGVVPEDLLSNKYGHRLHCWDLRARRHVQTLDLGANHQMALEVRPAHDPVREYGFLGVVVDTTNLEGSIWTWWREGGTFHIEKTATISAEPAAKEQLPPVLQAFGAVPPFVTDIDLSMDDRFLYVACWGTGELRQYDVTEPRKPKLAGSVRIGGIARRKAHPNGSPLQAVRRWWRSAATASASTGRTRFTRLGTINSIPMDWLGRRSWPMRARTAGSSWQRTSGWLSLMATGRTRSGSRVAIARLTRFATLRPKIGHGGLDTCRALGNRRRKRPLPRGEPGDGMAARRLGGTHGTARAWPTRVAVAAGRRPSAGNACGDAPVRAAADPR